MSKNILETIAEHARERVAAAKKAVPPEEIRREAEERAREDMSPVQRFPFEAALAKGGLQFICECKKASPSKGLIAEEFDYLTIARDYERAGAACISVLTEPKWFLGKDGYLSRIAAEVSIPVLRKDFTVDEYMIYEAKALGASAVLLIVSLLGEERLEAYIRLADSLNLSALVEAHDGPEIETALRAGARLIGVNNRNLKDFSVDLGNARRLRTMIPEGVLYVAESGVKDASDIAALSRAGVDAVLIGETMMRARDKGEMMRQLRSEIAEETDGQQRS